MLYFSFQKLEIYIASIKKAIFKQHFNYIYNNILTVFKYLTIKIRVEPKNK